MLIAMHPFIVPSNHNHMLSSERFKVLFTANLDPAKAKILRSLVHQILSHLAQMRDLVSCFSDYAVSIADTSCSSHGSNVCISPRVVPSTLNAVSNIYMATLSIQKQMMITVTWCKSHMSQGLSINFCETKFSSFNLSINSRMFRKAKGSKTFEFENWKTEVFWDLTAAKYQSSPEPVDGYYVVVLVDSVICLSLGNLATEAINTKMKSVLQLAKVPLVARKEQCTGRSLYTTKTKFCETGAQHDILIRCYGDEEGLKCPVLSISIDKKTLISVKRLQWNFRGCQSIFIDGLLIDVMWDVHNWLFFNPFAGYAVFMFRTRHGFDNRLWLEDKMLTKEKEKVGFSLLIHASRNS